MSIIPPLFSKFATNTTDLFKKKYDFDTVHVKSIRKAQNGVTVETGGVAVPKSDKSAGYLRGYSKFTLSRLPWGSGEFELHTDPKQVSKISTKASKFYSGAAVNLTLANSDKHSTFKDETQVFTAEASYGQDHVIGQITAKTNFHSKRRIEFQAAGGYENYAVGASVAFGGDGKFERDPKTDFQAGVEYSQDDVTATLHTTAEKDENKNEWTAFNVSLFHRVNRDLVVGANFKNKELFKLAEPQVTIGNDYRLDVDTAVRSKLVLSPEGKAKGTASVAVEHRLPNPQLLVGLAAQINVSEPGAPTPDKFGFSFTLGDF